MDVTDYLETLIKAECPAPQFIADALLERAMQLDENRPTDDISVVVVGIYDLADDEIRKMTVRLPLGYF